jgi:hypothetical protein
VGVWEFRGRQCGGGERPIPLGFTCKWWKAMQVVRRVVGDRQHRKLKVHDLLTLCRIYWIFSLGASMKSVSMAALGCSSGGC